MFLKHNNLTFTMQLSWPCLNALKNHWINCWSENFLSLYHLRRFNENLSKLQLELSTAKCVNTELTKRIVTLEHQCWANRQYWRKECVEVVGIPRQVDDKHLEAKVLSIFQMVGCTTAPEFIDDCHRLGKYNNWVIVKFTCKKNCKHVLFTSRQERLEGLNCHWSWFTTGNKSESKFVPMLSLWIKVCAHIIAFYGRKLNAYKVWVK